MKKAMKKILALMITAATVASVVGASVSAANYDPTNPNLVEYGVLSNSSSYPIDDGSGYYYGDVYVSMTAENWVGGKVTVNVKAPSNVKVKSYSWSGYGINTGSTKETTTVTAKKGESFNANCAVTIEYTRKYPNKDVVITETINVSVSSRFVYSSKEDAEHGYAGDIIQGGSGTNYPWWGDDGYWGDGYWDGDYYWTEYGYWHNGKWYYYDWNRPSSSSRYEYEVNWSTDSFYYNGKKQLPTATVEIGNRTIELDVRLTSGDGISVGKHRVVASLPTGYKHYNLTGTSLRYTIEEALKNGFVYEDGSTYYYENGKAVTGWKTVDGNTYYFEKGGKAATGWRRLNNAWYYFGSDGKMQIGWVRDGGKIYYCYDSGVMAKSTWLKLDGYWYYFYNDGRMAESEWVYSGGKWYFLAGDGRMATNTTIPGGYYVNSNGVWVK